MNKVFQSLVVLLVVSFSLSPFLVPHAEATENTWASKAPMHQARGGLGVAVVNGKIYAIGGSTEKGEWSISSGFVGTGGVVGTNEEYDPALDTWTFKTSMPTPRYDFAIAIYRNKIYCIGGATKTPSGIHTRTEVIEAYDPATNIWETKTPMPTRRDDYAIIEYQNKIYFIGGTTGSNYTTGLPLYTGLNEVYDPATDTWETKTPMPTAKVAEANIVNGKIYFIGGNPNNTLNQVYDPATDSWAIKTPIPTEAYGASAVINNKIYFISYSYSGGQYNVLNQIYDPETDKWSQGAPPPSGGVRQGSVVVTTGKMAPKRIYVLDEVLRVYNPETDGWTFGANISTYRQNLGIALVNDMLYAIGGNTYTYEYLYTQIRGGSVTPYATNEQYTPFGYGIVPSVVSPETNKTYVGSDIPLTFTLGKPASWIGYSLDGQESVTITGNTTLSGLPDGSHSLTVYAKDVTGNTGASETIYFNIKTQPLEPFPTWIVAVTVIVAVVGAAFLVYFRKIKKSKKELGEPYV